MKVRRKIVRMSSHLTVRSQSLGLTRAVQPAAIEVALRRIVRTRNVIQAVVLRSYPVNFDNIEIPRCDRSNLLPIPRNQVSVPPAVLLANPEKIPAFVKPLETVNHLEPRAVVIAIDLLNGTVVRIGEQKIVCVLQAV